MANPLKRKIAFLLPCDAPGGGIFVAYRHARDLRIAGHDVTVVFSNRNAKPEIKYFPGMDLPVRHISELEKKPEHWDAIISTWWGTFYEMFRLRASRYLYFVQSDERRFYPENSIERFLIRQSYSNKRVGIITEARWIQKMFWEEFGVEASYAPNGVDTEMFHPAVRPLSPRGEKVRILIEGPGSLPYKRIELAFSVAQAVRAENKQVEIWYVSGDGVIRPDWKADRVFERVPYSEMPAIYASCDILLKLSTVEGVFGPPLEMMACGGACVVSNVTGHDEYIRNGINALVVPMDSASSAESAVRELIDPNARRQMAIAGISTAKELDWRNVADDFLIAIEASQSCILTEAKRTASLKECLLVRLYRLLVFERRVHNLLRELKRRGQVFRRSFTPSTK